MEQERTDPHGGDQLPQSSTGLEYGLGLTTAPGAEPEQHTDSDHPPTPTTFGHAVRPGTASGAAPGQAEVVRAPAEPGHTTADTSAEPVDQDGQAHTATPERPHHTPNRIYVASLIDYTHGVLHGVWIDTEQDVEGMQAEVHRMLANSPTATETGEVAEEYAIHDYDGEAFSRLPIDEYERLSEVARIAELTDEHGEPFIVLAQHAGLDDLDFLEAAMRDSYLGHWASVEDFAEQHFEDMGATAFIESAPEHIRPFLTLDTGKLAEQLGSELTILDGVDGVYVFDPGV